MQIYKQNGKIVVALGYTDVLFNNSEKEGPLVDVDLSAADGVTVYVPPSNENIGIITGLKDDQYREISQIITVWIADLMRKNPAQPFAVSNKSLAFLPWKDSLDEMMRMYNLPKQQTGDDREEGF
jgi:hypothetical protein